MNSLWQETVKRPAFPTLSGDLSTDVLVVGGGMAGLLCAYRLQEAGAVASIIYASFARETLYRSVTGLITDPTVKQLK